MNIRKSPLTQRLWNMPEIEILDSGYAELGTSWNAEYMCPPYSRLYYILSGCGEASVDGQTMPLTAGNVYLLPIGAKLKYACPKTMTQIYYHIRTMAGDGYDVFLGCHHILRIPSEIESEKLAQAYLSDAYLPTALLDNTVRGDICRFIAEDGLEKALLRQHSPFLEKVFLYVRQNLASSMTIAETAKALSVSESFLSKRFRAEYGIPLGKYIDELVYREICSALASTSMSIGEIAERLGFCDQFYLARFFRIRQGISPREYRAKFRNQV